MKKLKEEEKLHRQVCSYVEWNYPQAEFNSDMSGVNLPPYIAEQLSRLRKGRGWPDFMMFEPRGGYFGLFIEIKIESKSPYRLNGELRTSKHIVEQATKIERLKRRGYFARFGVGFDDIKECIDLYMSLEVNEMPTKI